MKIERKSFTSICVEWDKSTDGGSDITGFEVEYHNTADPPAKKVTMLAARDVSSMTLEHLKPSCEYEVMVRAENAVGLSDPSPKVTAKAGE